MPLYLKLDHTFLENAAKEALTVLSVTQEITNI